MQYFGSTIVEGVAESWVETEMSWVELGGGGWSWVELGARFSNTHFELIERSFFKKRVVSHNPQHSRKQDLFKQRFSRG